MNKKEWRKIREEEEEEKEMEEEEVDFRSQQYKKISSLSYNKKGREKKD